MKSLSCRDIGFDCNYTVRAENDCELFAKGERHVFNAHGLREEEFTPKFNEKIKFEDQWVTVAYDTWYQLASECLYEKCSNLFKSNNAIIGNEMDDMKISVSTAPGFLIAFTLALVFVMLTNVTQTFSKKWLGRYFACKFELCSSFKYWFESSESQREIYAWRRKNAKSISKCGDGGVCCQRNTSSHYFHRQWIFSWEWWRWTSAENLS